MVPAIVNPRKNTMGTPTKSPSVAVYFFIAIKGILDKITPKLMEDFKKRPSFSIFVSLVKRGSGFSSPHILHYLGVYIIYIIGSN